jgi:hypothetical protein
VDLLTPRVAGLDSSVAAHQSRLNALAGDISDMQASDIGRDVSLDAIRGVQAQLQLEASKTRRELADLKQGQKEVGDAVKEVFKLLNDRLVVVEQRVNSLSAAPPDHDDDAPPEHEDDDSDDGSWQRQDSNDGESGSDTEASGNAAVAPESSSVNRLAGGLTTLGVLSPVGNLSASILPSSAPVVTTQSQPPSPVLGVGVDILTGSVPDQALLMGTVMEGVVEEAPGLTYAAQTSPAVLVWLPPTARISAIWLDMLGYRSNQVDALDISEAILSAGMSPVTTAFGASFLRITLLLPHVGWGLTLLIPSNFTFSASSSLGNQTDQLLQKGKLTLHRLLHPSAVAVSAPGDEDVIRWKGTTLDYWLTLGTPISYVDLASTSPRKHCAYHCRKHYSLRLASPLTLHLPSALIREALHLMGDRLDHIQVSALRALSMLSSMVIKLGSYTLTFRESAPSAAAAILLALSREPAELTDADISGLRCSVSIEVELRRPLVDYANYNIIHAVADSTRLSSSRPAEGYKFLGPSGKGAAHVYSKKLAAPERKKFQEWFNPPSASHRDFAAWSLFISKMESSNLKSFPEFTDCWLMEDIRSHRWLGQFCRPSSNTSAAYCDVMSVASLLALSGGVNVCIFKTNDTPSSSASTPHYMASALQPPAMQTDVIECVRSAIMDQFGQLIPIQPKGRHLPDPLGLDYSPILK